MCLVSTPHVPGTDGFERSNAVGQDLHRLHPIGLCGGPQGSPPSGARVVLGRGEPRTELVPIGFQTAKPKGEETRPPGDENEGTVDRRGTGGCPVGLDRGPSSTVAGAQVVDGKLGQGPHRAGPQGGELRSRGASDGQTAHHMVEWSRTRCNPPGSGGCGKPTTIIVRKPMQWMGPKLHTSVPPVLDPNFHGCTNAMHASCPRLVNSKFTRARATATQQGRYVS